MRAMRMLSIRDGPSVGNLPSLTFSLLQRLRKNGNGECSRAFYDQIRERIALRNLQTDKRENSEMILLLN